MQLETACKYLFCGEQLYKFRFVAKSVLARLAHQPKNAPILCKLWVLTSLTQRSTWLPVSPVEFYTLPFSSSQHLQVGSLCLHFFSVYIWSLRHPLELLFQAIWREKTHLINVCQQSIIIMEVSWHTASRSPINMSLCIIKRKLISPSIWLWLHVKLSTHWAMEHNPYQWNMTIILSNG